MHTLVLSLNNIANEQLTYRLESYMERTRNLRGGGELILSVEDSIKNTNFLKIFFQFLCTVSMETAFTREGKVLINDSFAKQIRLSAELCVNKRKYH